MDYKEKVVALLNSKDLPKEQKEKLESIFPELKESEDERIRKELICYFEKYPSIVIGPFNTKECIAWLEKQSTPQVRTGLEWVNTIDDACDKRYLEEYAHGEYCHEQSFKWGFQEGVDWLEKQGEQKPDRKFDGSKLKPSPNPYWMRAPEYQLENGQKQEWSEEDIVAIDCAVEVLNKFLPSLAASIERLKSLRPQSTWKPSDEQIRAFEWAYKSSKIEEGSQYDIDCKDLLEQLKAL